MTTKLTKPITRETGTTVFERSKQRPVAVTIYPSGLIGFRLHGTQRTVYLEAAACYTAAVKETERLKRLAKQKEKKARKR